MTYRELRDAVADLGFDTDLEISALVSATNRALRQIGRFCPKERSAVCTLREPAYSAVQEVTVTDPLTVCGKDVQALSLEYIGQGTLRVDGTEQITEALGAAAWREVRMLLGGPQDVCVTLTARGRLAIRCVALFSAVDNTANAEALPIVGERVRVPLRALFPDMLSVGAPPQMADGTEPPYYRIEGETAFFLPELRGSITLRARCRPTPATADHFTDEVCAGQEVDLNEDVVDLLPLLVASYVLADVEPEKAKHYKELYDEQYVLWRRMQDHKGGTVVIRKGWK